MDASQVDYRIEFSELIKFSSGFFDINDKQNQRCHFARTVLITNGFLPILTNIGEFVGVSSTSRNAISGSGGVDPSLYPMADYLQFRVMRQCLIPEAWDHAAPLSGAGARHVYFALWMFSYVALPGQKYGKVCRSFCRSA